MTTDIEQDVDAIQQIGAVPKILDAVCRTTGMGFVAIARVTADRWVCCAVSDNIDFGLEQGGELRVETTICNEIREHGKLVVIDDVEADDAFRNHPTPAMYGFRSYISAPIIMGDGTIWGTLCAIDPKPRALHRPEILNMFQLFGELIAAQLELSHRFEQSLSDLNVSEANLKMSESSRLSAEASLRMTQADLLDERQSSELREQFIGVLGHDLRNPLASIDAGMRVLLRAQHSERAPEIIAMIQKTVMRMAGLVDNLMDFARGRLGGGLTIKRAAEPLGPILEQVIGELKLAWPEVIIEASINLDEPIDCDRGKIGQLFSNLLGNAIIYGDRGKPIRVSAGVIGDSFELAVTNYGAPISEKAMQNLFKPFTRGDRPSQQGLGLGLYIASEIARAHGGTLRVVSTADDTTFVFEMPRTGPDFIRAS
jgi:signal transduction histidine kinase